MELLDLCNFVRRKNLSKDFFDPNLYTKKETYPVGDVLHAKRKSHLLFWVKGKQRKTKQIPADETLASYTES